MPGINTGLSGGVRLRPVLDTSLQFSPITLMGQDELEFIRCFIESFESVVNTVSSKEVSQNLNEDKNKKLAAYCVWGINNVLRCVEHNECRAVIVIKYPRTPFLITQRIAMLSQVMSVPYIIIKPHSSIESYFPQTILDGGAIGIKKHCTEIMNGETFALKSLANEIQRLCRTVELPFLLETSDPKHNIVLPQTAVKVLRIATFPSTKPLNKSKTALRLIRRKERKNRRCLERHLNV